jgi:K+-sensing histidine kinase KdpD
MSSATPHTVRTDEHPVLGHSLERMLGQPLAALRASIETLVSDLEEGDPHGRTLAGALEQVTRMARDLQSLVDYAAPRPLLPLRCTFEEIALCVLQGLAPAQRARLQLAHPGRGAALEVDGPLLATSLASLAQGALESAPGNLLLQARRDGETVVFTFVQADAGDVYEPLAVELERPETDAALAVRLTVARRDIARMGGSLRVQHTARGLTCVSVALPGAAAERNR